MKSFVWMTVLVGVFVGNASAAQISLSGAGDVSVIGNVVTVHLNASGFTLAAGDSLSGFDIDLLYNPAILQFQSVSFVDGGSGVNQLEFAEVGGLGFLGAGSAGTLGITDIFGVSGNSNGVLDSNQLASFRFALVSFQVLAASNTSVALDLADPNLLFSGTSQSGGALQTTYGATTTFFAAGGGTEIPEPNMTWLLPSCFGAIWLMTSRHRVRR